MKSVLKQIHKGYDLLQTNTCAPQCPFLCMHQKEVKSAEVLSFSCSRYNTPLKAMSTEDKVIRTKECKIISLELIFTFDE
jgi:hypothetical protein